MPSSQRESVAAEETPPTDSADAPSAEIEPAAPERAEIGLPAPDFELPELTGGKVQLSEHRGKVVVLEWFNPECPFVQASHTKGSLVGMADRYAKQGAVWLAINSNSPGKQGHGVEKNQKAKQTLGMKHPLLLDETGEVGRKYGARTTPHMFVIDEQGVLVYQGAIDNSPDGEGESPEGGHLVNYVGAALEALAAGEPIAVTTTEPYGCSVKYAD